VGVLAEDGPKAMVFEGPDGALKFKPEVFPLSAPARAFALGPLDDDYLMDLAIVEGRELMIVYGRDRELSLEEHKQAEVRPADVRRTVFPFDINAVAVGDFEGSHQDMLAILATDGAAYLTNARRVEVGDKKAVVNGKESSTEAQCIGRWPGARQLLTAGFSAGPADDLLLLDEPSHQLRILTAGKSASSDSVDRLILRPSAVLDSEGAPVTALPMRLNGDALSDLVILQSD